MHTCQKCGKEFDGKFCPECGEKYVDKNACPKCGAIHAPDAKYCPECGARLDGKRVCPKCGALSDGAFCTECGTKLKAEGRSKGKLSFGKVKGYLWLSGIVCIMLSALAALVFTFVCGTSAQVDGKLGTQTTMLYYYFGDAYKDIPEVIDLLKQLFSWRSIGSSREFALYYPVALGTAASAVGILGVVALCALTGFNAYRKFVQKREVSVIAPAVGAYLTFATLATVLLSLNAASAMGVQTSFSAATLAGLIVGGALLGLGVLLVAASGYERFKGFNAAVGSVSSLAVCALTVTVLALTALPAVAYQTMQVELGISLSFTDVKVGLFDGLHSMLLVVKEDEKIFDFITYCTIGGSACIALAVISAVMLFRKIPALSRAENKSCIILAAVNVALAVLYLAFTVLFTDKFFEVLEEEAGKSYAVPIVALVMSVLALAVEIFGKLVKRKDAAAYAPSEEVAEVAE